MLCNKTFSELIKVQGITFREDCGCAFRRLATLPRDHLRKRIKHVVSWFQSAHYFNGTKVPPSVLQQHLLKAINLSEDPPTPKSINSFSNKKNNTDCPYYCSGRKSCDIIEILSGATTSTVTSGNCHACSLSKKPRTYNPVTVLLALQIATDPRVKTRILREYKHILKAPK